MRTELTVSDAADAESVCAGLGDENREVPPGLVLRAHSALSRLEPDDVEPPERVRTLAGTVCDAADAVVLDAHAADRDLGIARHDDRDPHQDG